MLLIFSLQFSYMLLDLFQLFLRGANMLGQNPLIFPWEKSATCVPPPLTVPIQCFSQVLLLNDVFLQQVFLMFFIGFRCMFLMFLHCLQENLCTYTENLRTTQDKRSKTLDYSPSRVYCALYLLGPKTLVKNQSKKYCQKSDKNRKSN